MGILYLCHISQYTDACIYISQCGMLSYTFSMLLNFSAFHFQSMLKFFFILWLSSDKGCSINIILLLYCFHTFQKVTEFVFIVCFSHPYKCMNYHADLHVVFLDLIALLSIIQSINYFFLKTLTKLLFNIIIVA